MSIHSNPEIENIVNTATTIAKDYNHEYVTLEHLLIALVEYPAFNKLLIDFGVEAEELLRDLYEYIGKQATVKYFNLTPDDELPRFPYVTNIDRESYE